MTPQSITATSNHSMTLIGCNMADVSSDPSAFIVSTSTNGCTPPTQVTNTVVTVTGYNTTTDSSGINSITLNVSAPGVSNAMYRLCVRWSSAVGYQDTGTPLYISFFVFHLSMFSSLLTSSILTGTLTSVLPTVVPAGYDVRMAIIGISVVNVITDNVAAYVAENCTSTKFVLLFIHPLVYLFSHLICVCVVS